MDMYNVLKIQVRQLRRNYLEFCTSIETKIYHIHLYHIKIRSYLHNISIDRSDQIVNVSMLLITTT